jgi:inner membrane protein
MKFPLIGKALALGAVLLALLWALAHVSDIVAEREGRLREAQQSVAASLAGAQVLAGPVLQRVCTESWDTVQGSGAERKTVTEQRSVTLLAPPRSLVMDARAAMEPRRRGIYRVNGYAMTATVTAHWADLAALQPVREHTGSRLACAAPVLWVAVGDARGIRTARLQAQGLDLAVVPGTLHASHPRGFHASLQRLWPQAEVPAGDSLQAQLTLELAGTEDLAIAPIGDSTRVKLSSDWPHPSFNGRFLPAGPAVGEQGFDASWQVSALSSTAPRDLLAGAPLCGTGWPGSGPGGAKPGDPCIETFGVAFIDPVSVYVQSDRATKYGLLFIVLTFVAVALVEATRRLRVHPVQYLLVGSALALFFLLLVSLSEYLPFGWAYLAAGAACTALLAFYGSYVLGGWRAGAVFGAAMATLYGALYVLLQLEQGSLVLGSVLLFLALAAVMVATRRLDWFALMEQWRSGLAALPEGSAADRGEAATGR